MTEAQTRTLEERIQAAQLLAGQLRRECDVADANRLACAMSEILSTGTNPASQWVAVATLMANILIQAPMADRNAFAGALADLAQRMVETSESRLANAPVAGRA